MKVIIKDSGTGKYLSTDQTWTGDITAARDFHADSAARTALRLGKASRLRVVHYFEDLQYCIAMRHAGHRS
jgi:hypothetical protein